jgi:mono/diheme cytochrome c family protein
MHPSQLRRALLLFALLAVGGTAAFLWGTSRSAIPIDPSLRIDAKAAEVSAGAQLAAVGNCNVCHTKPDGLPYAGGRPITTPFGVVFSTNITPDHTGIRGWTQTAFARAMREGVSRDGRHLYPAFPYDHMARMHAEDIDRVYAFIMTRRPVSAQTPSNTLDFPFNVRALIAAWKLMFLDRGSMRTDPSKSPEWNRGAYLVEGLGHCGACHTPRNAFGAERKGEAYAGGESEGWVAPALSARSAAAVPWTAERIHAYLRNGFDELHGVAAGPMASVVHNLAIASDADVHAIAVYVADMAGQSGGEHRQVRESGARSAPKADLVLDAGRSTPGAQLYRDACAQCHGDAGRQPAHPALNLSLSSALRLPRPDNVVHILLEGIHPIGGGPGPIMPGFAAILTDDQLITLIDELRTDFARMPRWSGLDRAVRSAHAGALQAQR